jgi:stringent starvation protein B
MAFEVATTAAENAPAPAAESPASAAPALSAVPNGTAETAAPALSQIPDDNNDPPKKGGRPTLTRIK